ncbi:Adenine nucleotide alpha hydrolases-like protein [Fusarium austroafricanum]|uniref:Adenine nucleotide alpha hydrolases-like protein n=1 Tax=Fusarium austroafricanum TaxID=2364996 RepID=A0A8H4KI32_9HYPO|nr:Adenine nucleotide alpha hydrolases-like protein [Fusarium austroafricanum]
MRTRKGTETQEDNAASPEPRGHKRHSSKTDASAPEPKAKQAKKTKTANPETSKASDDSKPHLKLSDIEFEFDRSQLRDPRATPGRVTKPHYHRMDLSEEFISDFYIPKNAKPENNPASLDYDMHKCLKNGPDGPPTYDHAGFQLDFKKVQDTMKPRAYNKKAMVNGMERRLEKAAKDEKELYEAFFVDGKGPDGCDGDLQVKDYIKDHISKDLGVPWHQIDGKQARKWEQQGFEKVKADEWWREPNEEEKKRMLHMTRGSVFRKFL